LTGMQLNYYSICKRKLYIYSKGVSFESENEMVKMGKAIENMAYRDKNKNLQINNINVDFVDDCMLLSEVKKSDKMRGADTLQLKYYLYYLRKYYDTIIEYGVLRYPDLNKTEKVYLSKEDEQLFPIMMKEIDDIINSDICPPVINNKICKKCAYHDFCYI